MTDTLLDRLADCLHECSEELGNAIDARYGDTLRDPLQRRRYARDMRPVERARALLAELAATDKASAAPARTHPAAGGNERYR